MGTIFHLEMSYTVSRTPFTVDRLFSFALSKSGQPNVGFVVFIELQLQLKQAIRLGSPPSLMCVKRAEDAGTMSEDDGLPCSPPESTLSQAAMVTSTLYGPPHDHNFSHVHAFVSLLLCLSESGPEKQFCQPGGIRQ